MLSQSHLQGGEGAAAGHQGDGRDTTSQAFPGATALSVKGISLSRAFLRQGHFSSEGHTCELPEDNPPCSGRRMPVWAKKIWMGTNGRPYNHLCDSETYDMTHISLTPTVCVESDSLLIHSKPPTAKPAAA